MEKETGGRVCTVVWLKNPFDNSSAETSQHKSGKSLKRYLPDVGIPLKVVVNGEVVTNMRRRVKNGDYITVMPDIHGGDDWWKIGLGVLAGIAVIATGGLLAPVFGATFGAGVSATLGIGLAAGGFVYKALAEPQKPDNPSGGSVDSASPTYSWNRGTPSMQQGLPIGITYGTVSPSPQVLSQHISTDGNKQYLSILLCGGEGELDEIKNIRINGNPVDNYKDVSVHTRLGTNDQTVIPGFDNSYADEQVNKTDLKDGQEYIYRLQSTAANALETTVNFPQGLYGTDNQGNQLTRSSQINLWYRKVGETMWILFASDKIVVNSKESFGKTYAVNNLASGQYELRCVITKDQSNPYIKIDRVDWQQATAVIYDDFTRPGKVLVGIKALATDQLSGSLTVTWEQTRKNVWVWNPETTQYEQKAATNPAWAAFDMIHRCKRLLDIRDKQYKFVVRGAKAELLIYSEFAAWAAYCDKMKLYCNYFLDVAGKLDSAVKELCVVGRGKVLRRNTKFGCMFDDPNAIPVQMFSTGNIWNFVQEITGYDDRANAVTITFNNKERNYERDTVTAFAEDYDTTDEYKNATQITENACTDSRQAWRDACYSLALNKYLTVSTSFEADIDSIMARVGDMILLQHDVPRWNDGGRLASANGRTVTLDKKLTFKPGTYAIMIRCDDPAKGEKCLQKLFTVANEVTTDTITVPGDWEIQPKQYDLFIVGQLRKDFGNRVAKPFTITKISKSSELRAKIACVEYNADVYAERTPPDVIPDPTGDIQPVSVTGRQETWTLTNGQLASQIYATWQPPNNAKPDNYAVYISEAVDGSGDDTVPGDNFWKFHKTVYDNQITIDAQPFKTYWLRVIARQGVRSSAFSNPVKMVTGKDEPPPDVNSFLIEQRADKSKRFYFTLPYYPPDLAGFEIRYYAGYLEDKIKAWASGIRLNNGVIKASPYETAALKEGRFTVTIKAVDNAGYYSVNPAVIWINMGDEPIENVVEELDFRKLGWYGTRENLEVDANGDLVSVKDEQTGLYKAFKFQGIFDPLTAGTLAIQSDFYGFAQVYYGYLYGTPMWTNDASSMWTGDDKLMWDGKTFVAIPYSSKVVIAYVEDLAIGISGAESAVQTRIKQLKAINDMPDVVEDFDDYNCVSGWNALTLSKTFRSIKTITGQIQSHADSQAVAMLVYKPDWSKDPNDKAKVKLLDKDGKDCSGVVDITVKGW